MVLGDRHHVTSSRGQYRSGAGGRSTPRLGQYARRRDSRRSASGQAPPMGIETITSAPSSRASGNRASRQGWISGQGWLVGMTAEIGTLTDGRTLAGRPRERLPSCRAERSRLIGRIQYLAGEPGEDRLRRGSRAPCRPGRRRIHVLVAGRHAQGPAGPRPVLARGPGDGGAGRRALRRRHRVHLRTLGFLRFPALYYGSTSALAFLYVALLHRAVCQPFVVLRRPFGPLAALFATPVRSSRRSRPS